MVFSGTSADMTAYYHFKISPMASATAASVAPPPSKKRKTGDDNDDEEEDDDDDEHFEPVAEDGLDVFRDDSNDAIGDRSAQTSKDFYTLHDAKPFTIQASLRASRANSPTASSPRLGRHGVSQQHAQGLEARSRSHNHSLLVLRDWRRRAHHGPGERAEARNPREELTRLPELGSQVDDDGRCSPTGTLE